MVLALWFTSGPRAPDNVPQVIVGILMECVEWRLDSNHLFILR